MLDLQDAIILACATQGGALASLATAQTGLSRVAVSRRLKKLADTVAVMQNGKIVETGPVEQLLQNPQHPYTQALLRAVPRLAGQIL